MARSSLVPAVEAFELVLLELVGEEVRLVEVRLDEALPDEGPDGPEEGGSGGRCRGSLGFLRYWRGPLLSSV